VSNEQILRGTGAISITLTEQTAMPACLAVAHNGLYSARGKVLWRQREHRQDRVNVQAQGVGGFQRLPRCMGGQCPALQWQVGVMGGRNGRVVLIGRS